jgi:hypothetical protein
MTNVELISLFSSIAALILAIVAIWLSIVFYRLSSALSAGTTEAAKGINASVEKLENLFDKLYTDTFSMVRETVSDMRKQLWPREPGADDKVAAEIEKRAEEKIRVLKEEMDKEVSSMLHRQKVTDSRLSDITTEMKQLLDRAILSSRKVEVEAREETIREAILNQVLRPPRIRGNLLTADAIVMPLANRFPQFAVVMELEKMRDDGIITLDEDAIVPGTVVRFVEKLRH